MHLLDASSPVTAYKEYSRKSSGVLQDGEQIEVKVTLQAKQSTQFTYLDEIKGPWEIRQNDDGSISSWNR